MIRKPHAAARRAAAAVALAGLLGGAVAGAADASPVRFAPTYGVDRYMTSAFADDFPTDTAFLVTGDNYPDGLAAGAVAGALDGNVYLVQRDVIPQSVRERIIYAPQIVVVGGEGSISAQVMTWLQQNTKAHLSRVSGVDRFATSAALSRTFYPLAQGGTATGPVENVIIATGSNYPDALAGSAAAAHVRSPLLLVDDDRIPAEVAAELRRLQPGAITVVGGRDRVSDGVLAQLRSFTTGAVDRVAGKDRYDTAVEVSRRFFGSAAEVMLASGETYADALSAGARAGRKEGPLLLTSRACLTEETNLEIERLQKDVAEDKAVLESFGYRDRISEEANRRTNCQPAGTAPKTYVQDLSYVEGSGRYREDHVTLGGHFFPRSTAFDTDTRYDSTSSAFPNQDYGTWTLGGRFSRFTTVAGIADGNPSGLTATVTVFGDEREIGRAVVRNGAPVALDVDVRGVSRLKLVTTTTGAKVAPVRPGDNLVYFGDAAVS